MTSTHQTICFWNGNKSSTRRHHETELLSLCLREAGLANADIINDELDYPSAEDEGNIFSTGCDVLVSVAGNQKFLGKPTIIIEEAVCRGLLGHRLLVIQKKNAEYFANIDSVEQLQRMTVGVPATWADADLLRHNGFSVLEEGDVDHIFACLADQKIDYLALGANEVEAIFDELTGSTDTLLIEPSSLIYYPLPLVFYVHPDRQELAAAIERGLKKAIENGKHQLLFEKHHPNLDSRLGLSERKTFQLSNPYLPSSLRDFHPTL